MANRFSERVKILMGKHGWSMRDLSRQSGIPYSTIYDVLESGKTQPDNLTARNLKRLARTLGTSIDYLVGTWEDDRGTLSPPWPWLAPSPRRQYGAARWHYEHCNIGTSVRRDLCRGRCRIRETRQMRLSSHVPWRGYWGALLGLSLVLLLTGCASWTKPGAGLPRLCR